MTKVEAKFGEFLEALKKLHINIPFLEAILEMPSHAKLLKDTLSNKKKFQENVMVSLMEECRPSFKTSCLKAQKIR